MINPVKKKCLNCGYERQPEDESDFIPASECPKCRAIYEKVEKWLLKKEYEKAEEWLNEKERGKRLLKEEQQSREETVSEQQISLQEQKILVGYRRYLTRVGKADAMSYEQFKKIYKEHKEREEFEKENRITSSNDTFESIDNSKSYTPKCPTCGSENIEKISVVVKLFFLGPFAPLYKTFKCNNCRYKW